MGRSLVISHLDTSAAMKLLLQQPESDAVSDHLQSGRAGRVVASWLLHTELHCAVGRHPDELVPTSVALVLDVVSLIDLTRGDLPSAAAMPGRLRSRDAVHLATALRVGADELITYDRELADAATPAGLTVKRPS